MSSTRRKFYYFRCEGCRIEWIDEENENSNCLCCTAHGQNVSQNNIKERFDDIACEACEISWKGSDIMCPKCDQSGVKTELFKCINRDCPLKCWDDTKTDSNCPNCRQKGTLFKERTLRLKCQKCSIEWNDKLKSDCPSCNQESSQVSKKNYFKSFMTQNKKRFASYACVSCTIEWDESIEECPKCNKQGVKVCLFRCSKCNVQCWDDLKEHSVCPACSFDGIALKPKSKEQNQNELWADTLGEQSLTNERNQFTCASCENIWWSRLLISECKKCQRQFKALLKEEFGLCLFKCNCENSFIGRGAMKIKSKCYNCNEMILPNRVVLRKRRNLRNRKPVKEDNEKEHKHSCENCEGKKECSIFSKILFNSELA